MQIKNEPMKFSQNLVQITRIKSTMEAPILSTSSSSDGLKVDVAEEERKQNQKIVKKATIYGVLYSAAVVSAVAFNYMTFQSNTTETLDTASVDFPSWEYIGTSGAAKIDTYIRKVPGTKLLAFKGAVVLDHHIADVLRAYGDVKGTTEWVDLLQMMETLPIPVGSKDISATPTERTEQKGIFGGLFGKFKSLTGKTNAAPSGNNNILLDNPYQAVLSDIVYQFYALPWPVAPRDFVFHRQLRFYPTEHSVTAQYISTTDARRLPASERNDTIITVKGKTIPKHTIRAESPFTNWLFQDLDHYCASLQQPLFPRQDGNRKDGNKPKSAVLKKEQNPHRESYYHDGRAHAASVCAELASQASSDVSPSSHKAGVSAEESREGRRTYVEIEALVDNKGSLPAWLVNYIQRYALLLMYLVIHLFYAKRLFVCIFWRSFSYGCLTSLSLLIQCFVSTFRALSYLTCFSTAYRSWPAKTLGAFAAVVDKHSSSGSGGGSQQLMQASYTGALAVVAKW
jgi:hypothetical protein